MNNPLKLTLASVASGVVLASIGSAAMVGSAPANATGQAPSASSRVAGLVSWRPSLPVPKPKPAPKPTPAPSPTPTKNPNLITTRRIGTSVQGRAIMAYLVGDPLAARTEMVIGCMHGDEPAGVVTAKSIINGPVVKGVKIWVIPTINPDGLNRGTRANADGVDLNHNFPDHWTYHAPSRYYSGPQPMSEPESRAIYAFVSTVQPQYLVSLHQPYDAVDDERVKSRTFQHALSKDLGLPIKWTGNSKTVSHGTMVGYLNAMVGPTAAITVEFSANPSTYFLTTTARIGIVKAEGGSY